MENNVTVKAGTVVRFANPLDESEKKATFVVIEDRETRLFVEAVCNMALRPKYVYNKTDMEIC